MPCHLQQQFPRNIEMIGARRKVHLAQAQPNVAARTRLSPVSSNSQNLRISATRMSALQTRGMPTKRSDWHSRKSIGTMWRAACTRWRMAADDSPSLSPCTCGTPSCVRCRAGAGRTGWIVLVIPPWRFDTPQITGYFVDVDAVQQRARDALLVHRPEAFTGFGDGGVGAGAGLLAITVIAARPGIPTIPPGTCGTFGQIFHAK